MGMSAKPPGTLMRRIAFVGLLASWPTMLHATLAGGSLFTDELVLVRGRGLAVEMGDVDGDGALDVVAAPDVFLGSGGGTLQDRLIVPDSEGAWVHVLRDFNGDRHLDVAFHGWNQHGIGVLLGQGDGTFGPVSEYPTALGGLGIGAGDFDGDGVEDLVSSNSDDWTVSVLMGHGDGTFETEIRYAVGPSPEAVEVHDLNGDGLDDIISANTRLWYLPGTISVLLATGGGSFAPEVQYTVGLLPRNVVAGDWNHDDIPDLAVANQGSEYVSILMGLGGGLLVPEMQFMLDHSSIAIAHGDWNGDGHEDLAAGGWDGLSILDGNGDGTFHSARHAGRGRGTALAAGDLDGNGTPDLTVLERDDYLLLLFSDGADGLAPRPPGSAQISGGGRPTDLLTADLNNDGLPDLVTANSLSDDVSVVLGAEGGTFRPEFRVPVADHPRVLVAGDFDTDGLVDLAISSPVIMSVLRGQGDGTFTALSQIIGETGYPQDLAAGDLNLDSRLDLVALDIRTRDTFEVVVLLGSGDGSFVVTDREIDRGFPVAVALGDLNLDGRMDVVIACSEKTYVYLGNGDGTLQAARGPYMGGLGLDVIDLDGDGLPDVLLGGRVLLRGDGAGNLEGPTDGAAGGGPELLADLNGDGRLDLAMIDKVSSVSVLIHDGEFFTVPMRFAVGDLPRAIASADFNGDGRLDLATANYLSHNISILWNRGLLPNLGPRARADGTLMEWSCQTGVGTVLLDGSRSRDINSTPGTQDDIVSFEWWLGEELLGDGKILEVELSPGNHRPTLVVLDGHGEGDSAAVPVSVPSDTTPPELTVSLNTSLLWPPNHRMVEIQATLAASDDCEPVEVLLDSITSNEPDDAPGRSDGVTTDDVRAAHLAATDSRFEVRAERDGSGSGRIYYVTYRATDGAGNSSTSTTNIFVPHDRGGKDEPLELLLTPADAGSVLVWDGVPDALYYNVIRGDLGSIHEKPAKLHMGQVQCICSGHAVTDTYGFEDGDNPEEGGVFFYLVEYVNGARSSYGTASAPKPRVPQSGDCQ